MDVTMKNPRPGRRKSRFGCRNCKLRKLKCDETRPHCARCRLYGVLCNFEFGVTDLQPLSEERTGQETARRPTSTAIQLLSSPHCTITTNSVWAGDGATLFVLDAHDQDLFNRFRCRALFSLRDWELVNIYENHMLAMALSCPFLVHGILAVAAAHDRYLAGTHTRRRSLRESYHWAQCTAQFNRWLSQPLREEHKDPIWATAGTLAILAFSSINVSNPAQVWPLALATSSGGGGGGGGDLEWLRMGSGKLSLRHLVDPSRPGSLFRRMSQAFTSTREAIPERGTDGVLADLADLCGLHESSTPEDAYFLIAHSLSRLLEMSEAEVSHPLVMMISHYMHTDGQFAAGLERKDATALALFGLWYSRARWSKWWIDARAQYELPAICTYLRAHHAENMPAQRLLRDWIVADGRLE